MAETRGDHSVKNKLDVHGNAKFNKGVESPYLEIIDQKTSDSGGGTFTAGSWKTRDLTFTVKNDFATAINLSATPGAGADFTLPRGEYYCEISCPAFSVDEHVARLADVTDDPGDAGSTVVLGTSEFAADAATWLDSTSTPMVSASASQSRSFVTGNFTLAASRKLEIQHRCSNTQSLSGFGSAGLFYEVNNVFTIVKMWQVRDDA